MRTIVMMRSVGYSEDGCSEALVVDLNLLLACTHFPASYRCFSMTKKLLTSVERDFFLDKFDNFLFDCDGKCSFYYVNGKTLTLKHGFQVSCGMAAI